MIEKRKRLSVFIAMTAALLVSGIASLPGVTTTNEVLAGLNPICIEFSSCGLSPCNAPGALCWAGWIDDCHCGEWWTPFGWVCACR